MVQRVLITLLVFAGLTAGDARAQRRAPEPLPDSTNTAFTDTLDAYASGPGFSIVLTNSGFALGAYYRREWFRTVSFMAELNLGPGKDEREAKFVGPYWDDSTIPNKWHYLLMLPVQVGIQRRLFRDEIEDNFRPYWQVTAGPTLGWEYPYFDDCNGNGRRDPRAECAQGKAERKYNAIESLFLGDALMGVGGHVALGANFGRSRRLTQGFRVGYTFSYFQQPVRLMEDGIPGGRQRFFGSPTISITFGRLGV